MTDQNSPADAASRQRRLAEGFDLLRQHRAADAVHLADALRAEFPDDPEAHFLGSEARLAANDAHGALECIEAAVRLRPDEVPLLIKLAENLAMLRRRNEAKAVAARAAGLAPADGLVQRAVARVVAGAGDLPAAHGYYESALAARYAEPGMLSELAAVQQAIGDIERAEATVGALLSWAPKSGVFLHLRSTLRRATAERNHVAELQALLETPFPSDRDRAGALYALARELEDLGDSDAAFAAVREGASLRRAAMRGYDPAAEIATIDELCAAYHPGEMGRRVQGHPEEGPIFVVGMPLAGVEQVERMLARHSQIGTAGELLDFGQALAGAAARANPVPGQSLVKASLGIDFAALGRDYLRGAREAASPGSLFVDRLPANYMYCGLIRRALPNARIVHVTRDPMDSGFAAYRTHFGQAYLYSYDLREIADALACHERTMRHWNQVMPDDIVTVRLEDLVTDPEGQARRLLQALGLDWEPAVLAADGDDGQSAHVLGAIGHWRERAAELTPLKARLIELGVLDA